jgi:tetratricopeptide (TPR) repeat protein
LNEASSWQGCPDPSVLASFIEGALDAGERRLIEQHLADCPECPTVAAETAHFLWRDHEEREPDAEPARRRSWLWLAAAAAMAAVLMPPVVSYIAGKRDPLRGLKETALQLPARPVEGRLTDFEYVPFQADRTAENRPPALEVQAEAARIEEDGGTTSSSLHARGVAALFTGDVSKAVRFLVAASRTEPQSTDIWSDLAVAYLAAGDAVAGLTAANRAITLAPASAAAHFNQGLALQSLGRRREASDEYRQVIRIEPRSRWRQELDARIRALSE